MNKWSFILVLVCVFSGCKSNDGGAEKSAHIQVASKKFQLPNLPDSVRFCGTIHELNNFDVRERLDKELIVNTYYHSSTIQALKRANRFFHRIEKILAKNNIPEDFKYLCLIESGLTQAVSPSGAKGFWQFMPATAKEYGLRVNAEVDERLNIDLSTEAACRYLKDANDAFNDWVLTAASYNRGVGGIKGDLERQQVKSYFDLHLNNETSRYVFRILALKIIFENLEDYGFNTEELELYEEIDVENVSVNEEIEDLAAWAVSKGTTYRMVKLLNPWIIGNKLSNNNYLIQIPN